MEERTCRRCQRLIPFREIVAYGGSFCEDCFGSSYDPMIVVKNMPVPEPEPAETEDERWLRIARNLHSRGGRYDA